MLQRFSEKLRTLRERHHLSQKELANLVGFTREHINGLENGRKKPGAEIVFKIADVFGVPADQLVRDELELDEG
jgi:putative transcriptional regulator